MKKFFTFCALAVAAATTTMSAQELTIVSQTPDPAQPVEGLATIEIEFSAPEGYTEFDCNTRYNMTIVDASGAEVGVVPSTTVNGFTATWRINPAITAPGVYTLTVEEAAFGASTEDYSRTIDSKEMTFTYTVGSASQGDAKFWEIVSMMPEQGSKLSSLSTIAVEFSKPEGYEEFEVASRENMTVTKDGSPFTTATCKVTGDTFTWTFAQAASDPGIYRCTVEEGSLELWSEGYANGSSTCPTMEWTYTIENESQPNIDFTFDPAPGVVTSLKTLTLKLDSTVGVAYGQLNANMTYQVLKDGKPFTNANATYNGSVCILELVDEATEAGNYEVLIPAESIVAFDDSYETMYTNVEDKTFTYVIETAPVVVGDGAIEIASITPNPAETVSELKNIVIEFTLPEGYTNFDREIRYNMNIFKGEDNLGMMPSCTVNGNTATWTINPAITEAGTYTVKIDEAAFSASNDDYSKTIDSKPMEFTFTVGASTPVTPATPELTIASQTPAESETVTELSTVVVEFALPDGYGEMDLNAKYCMTIKQGETTVGTGTCSLKGTTATWTISPAINAPGTYSLIVDDAAFAVYSDDYSKTFDSKEMTFTYTVVSAGVTDKNWTIDTMTPEQGSVEELSTIAVKFVLPEGFDMFDVATKENMTVTKDGSPFTTGTCKLSGETFTWTLAQTATEPGIYRCTVENESLELWSSDYSNYASCPTMEWTFTVEGDGTPNIDFSFNPAPGVVESLKTLTLTTDVETGMFQLNANIDYAVTKNGQSFTVAKADYNGTLTLEKEATETGEYVITIPAKSIVAMDSDFAVTMTNLSEQTFTYIIEGDPTVVYDLQITSTKPAVGDVDMDMIQFESFIYTTTQSGVKVPAGKTVTFASATEGVEFEVELPIKTQMGANLISFVTSKQVPQYNGTYNVIIPKGTFGDDEWLANPNAGHSNDEIILTYNFTGLKVVGVDNTLMPTAFTPEANVSALSTITMTLPGVAKIAEGATAILSCVETRYEERVEITAADANVFTFNFPEATEIGTYTLIIAKETFFDAEYVETDGKLGNTNDTISHQWSVSTVGIESIESEDCTDAIFNLNGVCVGNDKKLLAPGIYIRNGKKLVVK